MGRRVAVITIVLVAIAGTCLAQPTVDTLWPNADGLYWRYEFHVEGPWVPDFTSPAYLALEGTTVTPGGTAQNLLAHHEPIYSTRLATAPELPSLLAAVWRARPDLRQDIESRYGSTGRDSYWWPTFLHDGYFLKSVTGILMWQDAWAHPTWTYLEDDLSVGAGFTFQLLPELADDVFLHGTVAAVDATVSTTAGVFTGAVRMDYVIDYGVRQATDEQGNLIGTVHPETRGHVHYVPGVGPVDMLEMYYPYLWADCGEEGCPPDVAGFVGVAVQIQTLTLSDAPVATTSATWGQVKAMYR